MASALSRGAVLIEDAGLGLFTEIFAWWTGNTWGTRLNLWKTGAQRVGADEFGNIYYRAPEGYKGQGERRMVTYSGVSEATSVPPLWHGWLHHQIENPPVEQAHREYEWQKPHLANMTGTSAAYRPPGSAQGQNRRAPATGDYEAWEPK
jgi:NADH:ubiquinone oxidoreductase subunit